MILRFVGQYWLQFVDVFFQGQVGVGDIDVVLVFWQLEVVFNELLQIEVGLVFDFVVVLQDVQWIVFWCVVGEGFVVCENV